LRTTITLALIYDNLAQIANVGDSRVYAWRSGHMTQITHDHSYVAELARRGEIAENEIASHPQSNLLLQALGQEDPIRVDLFEWEIQSGDKLLLCSDGLWKAFPDPADIAWWLSLVEAPVDLCWRLVLEANRRDGSDNISVVVVSVDEASSQRN
jgi:serine/threonine protein phosphatase PrpC